MPGKRASQETESRRVFDQPQKQRNRFRAGLYARVSTHDQQTLPLQSRAMRQYAARCSGSIDVQVEEAGSRASQRELRGKGANSLISSAS